MTFLGNAQILKVSLSPVASRIPVRYYANSRALTAFRKYWENVGWSFKGRLGCSASSAKVQSRFSVSRKHTVRTCIRLYTYTLLKCTRICTNDLGSKRHAIEIENRSKAGNLRESALRYR